MTPAVAPTSRRDRFDAAAAGFDKYLSGFGNNSTVCHDARNDAMVADATCTIGRLRQQAKCERYMLRDMPLWYNTWSHLQKPFVCGLPPNLPDMRLFEYASILTNRRPQ
jgi:hypothetical protein